MLFILGISGCVVLPVIKLVSNKKIIVSVDGLDPKREKWSWIAKKFLEISEWCAVKYGDDIISDNREIKTYIDDKYKKDSRLILYGADHSTRIRPNKEDIKQFEFLADDYAVAIARIEKENHSDIILEAFSNNTNLKLVFVGTWDGNDYSRGLFEKYESKKNIVLIDPIYDRYKINLIRSNAKIFIHGNSAGGTNPGLLEAMQVGLPIIAYDVIFNRKVTLGNALYFENTFLLSNNVLKYCNGGELIKRNGIAVKRIAKDNYRWEKIAREYKELFNS